MSFPRFIAFRLSRSQQRNFTRTIIRIATAAMAVSLAVMIVTTAMVTGFKKEISAKVLGFWGDIHISDIRSDQSYEALPITLDSALMASISDIAQVELDLGSYGEVTVRSKGGVRHVQGVAQIPAIINTQDEMEGIIIKGIGTDYDWSSIEKYIVAGQTFKDSMDEAKVLLSSYTADRLQVVPGDRFILHFVKEDKQVQRRFTVSGIYRTGVDYDQKFVLAPLSQVQQLLGWDADQVGAIEIFVEHFDDARLISEYLYLEELPSELYSETIRQRNPMIFEWLDLQDINQIVIIGLTIIVAVINMISVLLILILERTRMIGILKALGSSAWRIQKIFLYHAALIILWGLLYGNMLGLGLCLIQKHYKVIKLNEVDYFLSYAPINLNVWHILGLNAGTITLTLLFLVIPSLLVTRIDPVKTIQFR